MAPSFSLGLGSLELSGEQKILEGSSPVAFQVGGWLEGGENKKQTFLRDRFVKDDFSFFFVFFFSTPPPRGLDLWPFPFLRDPWGFLRILGILRSHLILKKEGRANLALLPLHILEKLSGDLGRLSSKEKN